MTAMHDSARFGASEDISSLSANQQKALAALLENTSIEAAATQAGLGVRTVQGYLAQENFKRVYRAQRNLILQAVVTSMANLGSEATQTLKTVLEEETDLGLRLRAASRVIDLIYKGCELERRIYDQEILEARISALEEAEARRHGRSEGNRWRT